MAAADDGDVGVLSHRRQRPSARSSAGSVLRRICDVEARRPGADVLQVLGHPAVEVGVAAGADLPQAGHAGLHGEPRVVPLLVAVEVVEGVGSRSDQAHVAPQDVPELGQLVEAGAAQEAAHGRHAGIVVQLERGAAGDLVVGAQGGPLGVGVARHGAELGDDEGPPVQAGPRLAEVGRPAVGEPDGDRQDGEDGRQHDEAADGAHDVQAALEGQFASAATGPQPGQAVDGGRVRHGRGPRGGDGRVCRAGLAGRRGDRPRRVRRDEGGCRFDRPASRRTLTDHDPSAVAPHARRAHGDPPMPRRRERSTDQTSVLAMRLWCDELPR